MIAAMTVALLNTSMELYSGGWDAEVGKRLVTNAIRLTATVTVLLAADNAKRLALQQRVQLVVIPLGCHIFGIWPPTGTKMFRLYLGGGLIANTGLSIVTTPPVMILQSTFLDWTPCFSQPGFSFPRITFFALP